MNQNNLLYLAKDIINQFIYYYQGLIFKNMFLKEMKNLKKRNKKEKFNRKELC